MARAQRDVGRLVDLAMLGKTIRKSRARVGDHRSFHVLSDVPHHIEDEDTRPFEMPPN